MTVEAKLFVVATPIGNLGDWTDRARGDFSSSMGCGRGHACQSKIIRTLRSTASFNKVT